MSVNSLLKSFKRKVVHSNYEVIFLLFQRDNPIRRSLPSASFGKNYHNE